MCGIVGAASIKGLDFSLTELTKTLSHRGPNDFGHYQDPYVGLGHRRLSIIDLDSGHQPMFNEDGSKCIVFNGEIYNFQALKSDLISRGHRFKTKSDTETILHAYDEWGQGCLDHLRGMFAFAIWDKRHKELFIARDRVGIKPLFYAEHNEVLYFASEMKAILKVPGFPRYMDETALASYFTLSYIPAPQTIYLKIRKLLPGYTLTWKDGQSKISQYWDLYFEPDRSKSEDYFKDGFMDLFEESVKMHMISDVPLGGFLSGGVDSGLVVALMSGASTEAVNTFCIGFGGNTGGYLDERGYARDVANRYGALHKEYEVIPQTDGLINTMVQAFDEPFADDSVIPSFQVCKIARENVTVALSGLGGDELFAGYERYLGFKLRGLYQKIPSLLRNTLIPALINRLPERADGHYTINHLKRFIRSSSLPADLSYAGYLSMMAPNIKNALFSDPDKFNQRFEYCQDLVRGYFNSPNVSGSSDALDRTLYCDIKTYLPEDVLAVTDRMSMQHSLEVRVPFLDHKLLEFCATIPPELRIKRFEKKYLLKKAAKNYLPKDVITHRKQGFVGPTARWIQTDLKPFVLETLSEKNLKKHGIFNPKTIDRVLTEHFAGKEFHDKLIWALVIFQVWFEGYVEGL